MSESPPPAPAPPRPGPAPAATDRVHPVRRYGAALAFAVAGLAATALLARQVAQWAGERDRQRFEAECRRLVSMIEQKMERYETALSRLRDVCARANGRPSDAAWRHWLDFVLEVRSSFPNLLMVAAAARETPPDAPDSPTDRIRTQLPVIRCDAFAGLPVEAIGPDLAVESSTHPDFSRMLQRTFGWNDGRVWEVTRQDGGRTRGFWFAVPLRPDDPGHHPPWRLQHESEEEAGQRREQHLIQTASGVLAAYLGGEEFLSDFNPPPGQALVALKMYTSTNTVPEFLLNPTHAFPAEARFRTNEVLAWYAKRWTACFASTPLFEAQSLRYRAVLVWALGLPLSLAGAGALAWQTRSRWREAALAAQLRDALARQERLSRDLHDGTLQSVYGIGLALQRARRFLERSPVEAAKPLADTTLAVQRVIEELRAFIREADPAARIEVPLAEALEGVVSHLRPATEMDVVLGMDPGADAGLDPGRTLQLLNIAREAISNSVRHSHGRRLSIRLQRTPSRLRLVVEDDGAGFDPAAGEALGRGLRNLAARVRELNGTQVWESRPGEGTRLTVEVPVPVAPEHFPPA